MVHRWVVAKQAVCYQLSLWHIVESHKKKVVKLFSDKMKHFSYETQMSLVLADLFEFQCY